LFTDPGMRARMAEWEEIAAFAVAVFRVDVARMGGSAEATALAEELQRVSPEFRRLWAENDVRRHGFGLKRLHHPIAGALNRAASASAVGGAEGLSMVVYPPASAADVAAIEMLLARQVRAA